MASLKEIRTRIESVQSTEQITTAMRMVSASKLRKAQQALSAIQPYSDALSDISWEISAFLKQEEKASGADFEKENLNEQPLEHVLLLVFSSNKGLCGPFNINAVKYTNELINNTYRQHLEAGKLHIITSWEKSRRNP